jgi:L-malate glycosyltransferase
VAAKGRLMAGRVLYLLDEFPGPHAGTEAQFWLLYGALDKTAWRPRVATLRPSAYLADHLPAGEYDSLDIGSLRSPFAWWRAFCFAKRMKREGFSVAHLYLNDVSVLFPPLLWLAGIRVIVSRRDLGFWYSPGLLRALRFNRRFVDRVIANCEAVKRAVCEAEGYPSDRVEVILNGFQRPGLMPPRLAASGVVRVGMLANLRPLKRVEDAIRAVAALGPDARVELVVGGEDRIEAGVSEASRLSALAAELHVAGRVRFAGPVRDSWAFLAGLDVFLSCSDTEGLSNSIIEAMASGLPVIGSAAGGTPELIEPGRTGYLYAARDVVALTVALENLLESADLRERFGQAATEFATARLSAHALLRSHEALYAAVSGRAGP